MSDIKNFNEIRKEFCDKFEYGGDKKFPKRISDPILIDEITEFIRQIISQSEEMIRLNSIKEVESYFSELSNAVYSTNEDGSPDFSSVLLNGFNITKEELINRLK